MGCESVRPVQADQCHCQAVALAAAIELDFSVSEVVASVHAVVLPVDTASMYDDVMGC